MADFLGKTNSPAPESGRIAPNQADRDPTLAERDLLRALLDRVLTAHEEERQRLAQALHDELAQKLTALSIELSLLNNAIASAAEADLAVFRDQLAGLSRLAEALIKSTRTLVSGLRPAVVEEFGLAAGLEDLASEFHRRTGLACSCPSEPLPVRLAPARARDIYRVVEHLLAGLAKAASGSRGPLVIQLHTGGNQLELRLTGAGLDALARAVGSREALDLAAAFERARRLGGTLEFQAGPADGTVAVLRVPAVQA